MNHATTSIDSALVLAPAEDRPQGTPSGVTGVPGEVDLVRMVLRILRGRVVISAILGVVLAAVGAIAPWLVLKPVYTATGLIRVAPTGRVILYEVEDNQPLSHYDSFVSTQQQLLKSRRILGAALEHESMARTAWPRGSQGIEQLVEALGVSRARGAEIIIVTLTHEEPALAATALNAVLAAYERIQIEGELLAGENQERLLEDHMRKLSGDVLAQRNAARQSALPVTPEALARMLQARSDDLATLRSTITQARMRPDDQDAAWLESASVPSLPVDQIPDPRLWSMLTRQDPEFAAMSDLLAQTERDLVVLSSRVGPRHREHIQLTSQRDAIRVASADRLERFRQELRDMQASATQHAESASGPATVPLNLVARLEAEERLISDEISALAQRLQGVQAFLDEADRLDAEVAEVRNRLERLRFERQDQNFGRITVEERAAVPSTPSNDRRVPLSAAAGLGGLGAGVGLVVLFGLVRPTLRFSDEASDLRISAPLLAAIPDMTSGSPQDREVASFSVHHLRQLIEVGASERRALSIAVTSPCPGDGKTQVTLSLAASFASAGRRVVAVDLDFLGRGLSRATGHDADLGLAEHLAQAQDLSQVIVGQNGTPFAVVPAGNPGPEFPATLNTSRLRDLLRALSGDFEVVLVDTGPVLGSLEASALVGAADFTLVIVGRGQRAPLVRGALARISSLGGQPYGLVFNRASSIDVQSSLGSVSARSSARSTATRARPDALSALYAADHDHSVATEP